jgi:hypothetical protein
MNKDYNDLYINMAIIELYDRCASKYPPYVSATIKN